VHAAKRLHLGHWLDILFDTTEGLHTREQIARSCLRRAAETCCTACTRRLGATVNAAAQRVAAELERVRQSGRQDIASEDVGALGRVPQGAL